MRGTRSAYHCGKKLRAALVLAAAAGMPSLIAGCASTARLPAPPDRLSTAVPLGFNSADEVRFAFDSPESFRLHSLHTFARARQAAADDRLNILALSGGGAGGAFGAGALIGWSRSGKRPEFQIVTGVSVGALIAPLAYLGPAWDPTLQRALDGEGSRGLLQRRLVDVLLGSSIYRGKPLRQLVERFASPELLDAVAREYRRGRMLFLETTDLDKGEPVIWNMGAIAAAGGAPALTLFRQVLQASASIPAVFPPVLIRVQENGVVYDEMHVDGAASVPMFIAPEVGPMVTQGAPQLGDARVYLLVNGRLGRFPVSRDRRTLDIFNAAFETNLAHGSRAAMALAFTFARNYGMQFLLTRIPAGYPFNGPLDFDPQRMHALFEYGERCAEAGELWNELGPTFHDAMTAHPPQPGEVPACPAPQAPEEQSSARQP